MIKVFRVLTIATMTVALIISILVAGIYGWVNKAVPKPMTFDQSAVKGDVFYFAYGSNTSYKYLKNVRGVSALSMEKGILRDYALMFTIQGPNSLEPGFANVVPAEKSRVEGVLYSISSSDFDKILESEKGYSLREVVILGHAEKEYSAQVLIAKSKAEEYIPSRRYMSILLDGAKEADMSYAHISYLEAYDTAYVPIFSELMGAIVYIYVIISS